MYINRSHIVIIEPVRANSRVSQLIVEAKKSGGDQKSLESAQEMK